MIYEANEPSSACNLGRIYSVETSAPPFQKNEQSMFKAEDRGMTLSSQAEIFEEIRSGDVFLRGAVFRLLFLSSSVCLKEVNARRRDVGPNNGGAQVGETLKVDKVFGAEVVGELNEAAGVAECLFNLSGDFLA